MRPVAAAIPDVQQNAEPAKPAKLATMSPVSYTHLDVYKRQIILRYEVCGSIYNIIFYPVKLPLPDLISPPNKQNHHDPGANAASADDTPLESVPE